MVSFFLTADVLEMVFDIDEDFDEISGYFLWEGYCGKQIAETESQNVLDNKFIYYALQKNFQIYALLIKVIISHCHLYQIWGGNFLSHHNSILVS